MSSPQPPNQPPRDNPIGDAADRTQVVRPGQGSDEGPERTQAMQPGQPAPQQPSGGADRTQVVRPAPPPQQQQPGGFNPGQQQGGFNPGGQQGGGGFNPNPPSGQQGGFNPGGQQGGFNPGGQQGGFNPGGQQGGFNPNPQGPPSGGFSPGGPGGPPQGGFNPGGGYPGGQQGGFSPGGGGPSGFGPAANDQDKIIALCAAGSAALFGLIVVIVNLANIGFYFDASGLVGLLSLLLLILGAGLIGGGVLIFMRNRLGPLLVQASGAAYAAFTLILIIVVSSITGIFSGGGLVGLLLVAIPTVLAFLPGTKRYANSSAAPPGFGQQGPQGGYGRPF